MADLPSDKQLKVALIYSFGVNDADADGMLDENSEDTSALDGSARDFLDAAIADYNRYFGTSYDTSSDKFQNYYKDLSERVKNRELDLLIVVNMFLTGFDATTLNTLWVDKNLRAHGLLQAYPAPTASSTASRRLATLSASATSKKRPMTPSHSSVTKKPATSFCSRPLVSTTMAITMGKK